MCMFVKWLGMPPRGESSPDSDFNRSRGEDAGGHGWRVDVNIYAEAWYAKKQRMTLHVSAGVNVADLKDMLASVKGIPANEQRWVFAGRELQNQEQVGGPNGPWVKGDSQSKAVDVHLDKSWDYQLVLTMALHRRLGIESSMHCLDDAILKYVCNIIRSESNRALDVDTEMKAVKELGTQNDSDVSAAAAAGSAASSTALSTTSAATRAVSTGSAVAARQREEQEKASEDKDGRGWKVVVNIVAGACFAEQLRVTLHVTAGANVGGLKYMLEYETGIHANKQIWLFAGRELQNQAKVGEPDGPWFLGNSQNKAVDVHQDKSWDYQLVPNMALLWSHGVDGLMYCLDDAIFKTVCRIIRSESNKAPDAATEVKAVKELRTQNDIDVSFFPTDANLECFPLEVMYSRGHAKQFRVHSSMSCADLFQILRQAFAFPLCASVVLIQQNGKILGRSSQTLSDAGIYLGNGYLIICFMKPGGGYETWSSNQRKKFELQLKPLLENEFRARNISRACSVSLENISIQDRRQLYSLFESADPQVTYEIHEARRFATEFVPWFFARFSQFQSQNQHGQSNMFMTWLRTSTVASPQMLSLGGGAAAESSSHDDQDRNRVSGHSEERSRMESGSGSEHKRDRTKFGAGELSPATKQLCSSAERVVRCEPDLKREGDSNGESRVLKQQCPSADNGERELSDGKRRREPFESGLSPDSCKPRTSRDSPAGTSPSIQLQKVKRCLLPTNDGSATTDAAKDLGFSPAAITPNVTDFAAENGTQTVTDDKTKTMAEMQAADNLKGTGRDNADEKAREKVEEAEREAEEASKKDEKEKADREAEEAAKKGEQEKADRDAKEAAKKQEEQEKADREAKEPTENAEELMKEANEQARKKVKDTARTEAARKGNKATDISSHGRRTRAAAKKANDVGRDNEANNPVPATAGPESPSFDLDSSLADIADLGEKESGDAVARDSDDLMADNEDGQRQISSEGLWLKLCEELETSGAEATPGSNSSQVTKNKLPFYCVLCNSEDICPR